MSLLLQSLCVLLSKAGGQAIPGCIVDDGDGTSQHHKGKQHALRLWQVVHKVIWVLSIHVLDGQTQCQIQGHPAGLQCSSCMAECPLTPADCSGRAEEVLVVALQLLSS